MKERSALYKIFLGHRIPALDHIQGMFNYNAEPVSVGIHRWTSEAPANWPHRHYFGSRMDSIVAAIRLTFDETSLDYITLEYPDRRGPRFYNIPERGEGRFHDIHRARRFEYRY